MRILSSEFGYIISAVVIKRVYMYIACVKYAGEVFSKRDGDHCSLYIS